MLTAGDDAAAGASHSFRRAAATATLLVALAPSTFVQGAQAPPAAAPKAERRGLRNLSAAKGPMKPRVGGSDVKGEKEREKEREDEEEEEEEEEKTIAEVAGSDGTAEVAATSEIHEGAETDSKNAEEERIAKAGDEEVEEAGEGEGDGEEEGPSQEAAATTPSKTADSAGDESSPVRRDKKRRQIKRHQSGVYGSKGEEGGGGDATSGGREAGPAEGSAHDVGGAGAGRDVGGAGAAAAGEALTELRATEEVGEEVAEQRADEDECRVTGECHLCEKDELDLEYCRETRRRQEVRCPVSLTGLGVGSAGGGGGGGIGIGILPSSVQYRPCTYAVEEDFQGLLHFWLAMLVVGALACFGMRRRQQSGGSLYDRRAK